MKMVSDVLINFIKAVVITDLNRFGIKIELCHNLWDGWDIIIIPPQGITIDNVYEYIKLQYPNCYEFFLQSRRS